MSRLLRRFRLLVPPATYIVLYVIVYLACNLRGIQWGPNPAFPPADHNARGRQTVLIAGLLVYGAYRVLAFHPFYRAAYRKWLETTPWTWRKPLPVGPVYPVIEDVLIVSAMSAPAWYFGDFEFLATFSLPLGAYLMTLCGTFRTTGAWGFHVPVAIIVGLALRLWDQPAWAYSGAILLALVFGLVGLGRSLKRWPWNLGTKEFDPAKLETMMGEGLTNQLGWPYDRLGPRHDGPITWRATADTLFFCVVIAWWFYAFLGLTPDGARGPIAIMVMMYVMLFSLVYRISHYMIGYASPLGLFGRIARLSPIIPSYDQVFVAPITAIVAVTLGPWMLGRAGMRWDSIASISMGVALMALFLGGPDRRRWQLTAKHRVVPAINGSARTKGGFIQVG